MHKYYFSNLTFNPVLLAAYVVMFMAAEMVQLNTLRWWDPVVSTAFNLVCYASLAWIVCLVAALAGDRWGKAVHGVCHVLVASYAVSTLFLAALFHRHWDAYTLTFVVETNGREASEFLSTYLTSWQTWAITVLTVVFFALEWWAARLVGRMRMMPQRRLWRVALVAVLALTMGNAVFFTTDADRNYDLVARMHSPVKRNALWTLWQSVVQYADSRTEFERCAAVQRAYRERVVADEAEADLVVIVGESFSRHMSNLYDGKYDTNPLLRRRLLSGHGRLVLFDNVIASDNGTTQNFKYFMSTASVADSGVAWCDHPLFPAVVRRSGYNVTFYSNQFVANDNLGQWDASMGFFNHPGIEPYLFDHRNSTKYPYDMELVADFAARRQMLMRPHRNLCIFHLYGQHVNFSERYPSAFARFSAADVSPRYSMCPSHGNLDDKQRADIATYLNATAYNDMVVDSIMGMFDSRDAIVVYFSDHGEEVHNFRRQYGRTDLAADTEQALHCQLDVPFMIYMTPRYVTLHPELARSIAAAAHRPFMTDDLPHVLFNLLGIHTRLYRPERSVINARYRQPARRRLQNGRWYE